jgi:hypothetical protein
MRVIATAVALGVLGLSGGALWAQEKEKPAAGVPGAPPAKKDVVTEGKKNAPRRGVLRLEGDVIEGKVQKPEAFYLLNRASMTFEGLKLETTLVPKILKSLRKPPL